MSRQHRRFQAADDCGAFTLRIVVVMGGNVSQSVSPKRLKINGDGTLVVRKDSHGALPWIAVLKCLG